MASHRTLELTLISAKDLKNVNFLSALEIYAVAGLSSDPRSTQRTPADRAGRKNPTWNATIRLPLPASAAADSSRLTLDILLRAQRALGDRDVGEVHVPLADLDPSATGTPRFLSYQVRRPSGKGKGVLNLSYRFVDPAAAKAMEEPVTAYPVFPQPHAQPHGYPGYQQPAGYGYPYAYASAAHAGYGSTYGSAPTALPQQPRKSRFGLGLLGGALGGLLIGDALSDAATYDAGYDAGFGDASFDF